MSELFHQRFLVRIHFLVQASQTRHPRLLTMMTRMTALTIPAIKVGLGAIHRCMTRDLEEMPVWLFLTRHIRLTPTEVVPAPLLLLDGA